MTERNNATYATSRSVAENSRYNATPRLSDPGNIEWIQHGTKRRRSTELEQILNIANLAKAGRISALKQCAKCSKWLFARFPHQRFCSDACKGEVGMEERKRAPMFSDLAKRFIAHVEAGTRTFTRRFTAAWRAVLKALRTVE
jgi:hypothetical protein